METVRFRPEAIPKILSREKNMTCRRTDNHGEPGDLWRIQGTDIVLRILRKQRMMLSDVAQNHYRQEGHESPEEFIDFWDECYPEDEYDPLRWVVSYVFEVMHNGPSQPG